MRTGRLSRGATRRALGGEAWRQFQQTTPGPRFVIERALVRPRCLREAGVRDGSLMEARSPPQGLRKKLLLVTVGDA